MKLLVIAGLQESQIKYKIIPLSKSSEVEQIYLLRKKIGPEIPKVHYVVLPTICRLKLFYLILAPIYAIATTRKKKINLIISYHYIPHGIFAYITHRITKVPFIYSQIDQDIQRYMRYRFLAWVIIKTLKRALRINVPGSRSMAFWSQRGFSDERLITIHSTIDAENDFYPDEQSDEKPFDFIYIGTYEKRKRVDLLVAALAESKMAFQGDFRLAIVGWGTAREEKNIRKLISISQLSDSVQILGYRKDIRALLNSSKSLIMLSDNEGIPCVLLEAMACGVIPIITDVADVSDVVVHDENGFILPLNPSKERIVKMINRVLKGQYSSAMKQKARRTVLDYHSYNSAIRKWNDLFINIVEQTDDV